MIYFSGSASLEEQINIAHDKIKISIATEFLELFTWVNFEPQWLSYLFLNEIMCTANIMTY